jgi:hypothetical protein
MNVADLFAGEPIVFPSRLATALDETTVGDKLLYTREASDVMDLVENSQGQDLADAGDRAEQIVRARSAAILVWTAGSEKRWATPERLAR